MVYRIETAIARRTASKGVVLSALCSVSAPFRHFADMASPDERDALVECPICKSTHRPGDCLAAQAQ
jgi:hypothetical protein